MGLYDNVGVGSSSNIYNTNSGIPLDALQHSSDILNQRYTDSLSNLDSLNSTMKTAQGFFKNDKTILAGQQANTASDIKNYTDAGDFEHLGRSVQLSARKFGNVYSQISANTKGYQDYAQSLQDMQNSRNPNESIDPQKAKDALTASLNRYGDGMQIDPVTGRLTNYFKGIVPSATYDISKETLDAMKEMHPNEVAFQTATLGSIPGSAEYNIRQTHETGRKELRADKVAKAAQEYILSNPRYMADIRSRNELHAEAQGRDASADEYKGAYIQQRMNEAEDNYTHSHPKATDWDRQAAARFEGHKAMSDYDERVRNNPNYNLYGALASHRTNQYIGMEGKLAGDTLSYANVTDRRDISGTHPAVPVSADGSKTDSADDNDPLVTYGIVTAKTVSPYGDYDSINAGIKSSQEDVERATSKLAGIKKLQKEADAKGLKYDYSADIKDAQDRIAGSTEMGTNLSRKKAYYIHKYGLDKQDDPAATTEEIYQNENKTYQAMPTGVPKALRYTGDYVHSELHPIFDASNAVVNTAAGWFGSSDPVKLHSRYGLMQAGIADDNLPGTTESTVLTLKDKNRNANLQSVAAALSRGSNALHTSNEENGPNTPVSDDLLKSFGNNIENKGYDILQGKESMIMEGKVKLKDGNEEIHQFSIPMTESNARIYRKAAGITQGDVSAARSKSDIDGNGYGYAVDIKNKRGGGVSYERAPNNEYTKTAYTADGRKAFHTVDGSRAQADMAAHYSDEYQFADNIIANQASDLTKTGRKSPYTLGNNEAGAAFSAAGPGKTTFTHWNSGQKPQTSILDNDDAAIELSNLTQKYNNGRH